MRDRPAFYEQLSATSRLVSSQERIVIEKADQEEAAAVAAIRPAASAVEYEQHETTETMTSAGMPAITTTTTITAITRKCVLDTDVYEAPTTVVTSTVNHSLERPANLSLAKQEINLVDALSIPNPASPISKQVNRLSDKFFKNCSHKYIAIKQFSFRKILNIWYAILCAIYKNLKTLNTLIQIFLNIKK